MTTNTTTARLIEALQAFIADQGRTISDGIRAAAEGDDARARGHLQAVESEVSAVVEALRFDGVLFGWSDGLRVGLSDPIVGLDLLAQYVDRDGCELTDDDLEELRAQIRSAA